MKDKLIHLYKRAVEEAHKLKAKFSARIAANTNEIHRSYWALPPETRARLRLVIICVSILFLGIVIGLFVYSVLVAHVKHFSGWAGTLAIGLIAIPVVVRTTENMLRLVPTTLREAAYALGAPKWKVSLSVILRAAKSGVITGILLAIARVSGETAPLLFTALNNQFFSSNMNAPMANLPVVIFQFAMSPYENWVNLAWAGALLITFTVLGLNILARVFFRDKS